MRIRFKDGKHVLVSKIEVTQVLNLSPTKGLGMDAAGIYTLYIQRQRGGSLVCVQRRDEFATNVLKTLKR